ncbi:acyl-CoA:lysophosphatidylglycerol acyltransferase 1-like [Anthonomus grandis grandis]|uniref:acyl-CoA:lysophosphatidylglycerol acyltransferase 1-like n=1 Tax=Anthonomus grandis grandis TaxID=2921223 RepID=UPI002165B54E|nr:acyl-CoA:lysophosphatidylglycerol acyltransferase 1-like [Anthonomus grandis grandis]
MNLHQFALGLFRVSFILLNNLYCIPTYVVWMLLLWPLRKIAPSFYWNLEGYLFQWLLAMVSLWCESAGYKIIEMGEDISKCLDKRTLLIANHQSTADVPMIFSCFNNRKNVLPNIMWIMDSLFKYTNFGVVSYLHQDFFIKSGKENREKALQDLSKHLVDKYLPLERKWLVLFPEGGFLRKRKPISHRYAEKNGLPKFENVSLPRVGALKIIMSTLGPQSSVNNNSSTTKDSHKLQHIDYILDITIAYPNAVPIDLSHIAFGSRPPCDTIFFYRVYQATEVPEDSEAMTSWLFDRWAEKERMLQSYYDTGEIPLSYCRTKPCEPQLVAQDYLRFLLLHIFFITSSYLHVKMLLAAYQFCMHFLVY